MRFLFCVMVVLLIGCPVNSYRRNFTNVTNYKPDLKAVQKTAKGIRYWAPSGVDVRDDVDRLTDELEKCLGISIRRDWFGVYIPSDAYVSACSGQWLVPSVPDCYLCIDQKGLPLPKKCCGLRKPTKECPCVCNMRSVVQDGWLIITTKTLMLYKDELARLVTGVNFPWGNERIKKCLR